MIAFCRDYIAFELFFAYVFAEFNSSKRCFYQFYWRLEMLKSKSTLNLVMLFSALLGLVFVIGCGGSAEKQEMTELLKLYSDAVSEYESADETKRAQLEEKIDAYRHKWSAGISDLNDKVTPQVMNELESKFKEITKRYESLHG